MSGMTALAEIEMFSPTFPVITHEERRKIAQFKLPCKLRAGQDPRFYPRRPVVNVRQWFADHEEKVRQLMVAAGMPRPSQ